ncbi:unnamed protein product, partial [Vitrella brassicaformis CCMP3155]
FKYGRFETRLFPSIEVDGTVATFFLFKNDSDKVEGASWQEIDFEVHGMGIHSDKPIQTNMISGAIGERSMSEKFFAAPGRPGRKAAQTKAIKRGFHHFAVEWTPDHVSWYFDERRMRRVVSCDAPGADAEECSPEVSQLNGTMNLRMSLWPVDPALNWAGVFDEKHTKLPLTVYYDYVKVYDYDPISKGFSLKWADDFTSFNSSRWEAGTHTFDRNYAHFRPDKAIIVEGDDVNASYLALSLTPANASIVVPVPRDTKRNRYEHKEVCEAGTTVVWEKGLRYEGGILSFAMHVPADDGLVQCAAACAKTAGCSLFSVYDRSDCTGFVSPARQVQDERADAGFICMDGEPADDRVFRHLREL